MDTKQPLSLFLVAILAASVFTVVGISSLRLQNASAQEVTIETSADNFGGVFYGESYLQVVINDPDADDDDTQESLLVTVDVDPESGAAGSKTFDVLETSDSSGRFEFFLVHEGSDIAETFLDPINNNPIGNGTGGASVVTFGPTGASAAITQDQHIVAEVNLGAEDADIDIQAGDEEITVHYEQYEGIVELDRDTFGSTSIVHLFIVDQDSNNDPTNAETFTVTNGELNGITFAYLFNLEGGNFGSGNVEFTETGDNTARFEAELQISDENTGADNELVFTTDTLTIELHDHADYRDVDDDDSDVDEDSTDTSEVSFEINDEEGDIDDVSDLTFGGELKIVLRDQDQNEDSEEEDDIPGALKVTVGDGGSAFDSETLDLTETGDNTGVFEIDLSNGELRITFLDDDTVAPTYDNGILELLPGQIEDEDITIYYTDPLPDGATNPVASFTVNMATTPGQISAPTDVGVIDEFTVTITDPDLNDNPRTRDSYQWNLTGTSPFSLTRGGLNYSEVYTLEIELDGEPLEYPNQVLITMRETDVNTGIFEFDIDMKDDIADVAEINNLAIDISDGDNLELTINDAMSDFDDPDDDRVSINVGKANVGLDYDRTSVPIPAEDGGDTDTVLGNNVVVRLILVDPTLGDESNVEEVIPFEIDDPDDTEQTFTVEVNADDFQNCQVTDGDADSDNEDELNNCELVDGGVTLADILDIGDLEETGKNTNVFEAELTFTNAGTDASDWQDMEITFTYTNDEGDDESAGFTFRGSDGVVTVDQPSAKAGTIVTVTVEDPDLNLDTDEVESFESSIGTDGDYLVSVETEDDEIDGGETLTFEETGEDTGVFAAEFEVGEDIPIVDVQEGDQASNILVTYNDEIDSTGGGGDELEVNLPIVSATGSIQVTPELVGPATTLTVLIIDSDLDEDASSTDEYTAEELDESVEFASSRSEVNDAVPDIEETGPNTGVFMFELELKTDAQDCADDDLDAPEFEATGGDTDSSIGACPGDLISIRYEDEHAGSGSSNTVSEVIEVQSWDPEFAADQDNYSVGDRVTVSISDPDANRDPDVADSLTDIRVTSDSDQVGEEFSAIETGKDTGVFRLTFGTTSGTAGGAISVKTGDDITIRYTDEFPADFVDEEEDKDFDFIVHVGTSGVVGSTTVTPPETQDVTGKVIDEVSVGQQVVLATSVRNNQGSPTPFVALIEVRDDAGVTVFLAWQTGTLPASGQTKVGLSWTPDIAGDYEVRTFVISDLNNPQVLSEVSTSNITVS